MARTLDHEKKFAKQAGLLKAHNKAVVAPAPKPKAKPTMADNYRELGSGMAKSAKRMIEQRKIIADPKKK
jgi:hypothetical protein